MALDWDGRLEVARLDGFPMEGARPCGPRAVKCRRGASATRFFCDERRLLAHARDPDRRHREPVRGMAGNSTCAPGVAIKIPAYAPIAVFPTTVHDVRVYMDPSVL